MPFDSSTACTAVRSASAASLGRPRKVSPLASSIRLLAASLIHMPEMYDSTLASSSAGAICGMTLISLSRRLMSMDDARAADGGKVCALEAVGTDDGDGDAEDVVRWRERRPKTPPVV